MVRVDVLLGELAHAWLMVELGCKTKKLSIGRQTPFNYLGHSSGRNGYFLIQGIRLVRSLHS